MGRVVWTGEHLWNLLNLPLAELLELYPTYTKGTIKGKIAYWRKQLKEGKVQMPPKPAVSEGFGEILKLHGLTPELAEQFTEQGFHVGYIKNADGEIEYTIPLPNAKTGKGKQEEWPQASPARIVPSRRKAEERDYKSIFVFTDAQMDYRRLEDGTLIPLHDERALTVARLICRDVRPDLIVNLGDMVDLTAFGQRKYGADSDHFSRTLGPSFQRAHDYYAELRSDNPDAEIVEVDSNHNTRLSKFVRNEAPMFYGVKRPGEDDYPVMSYGYLANLGHVGVRWISGYPAAELVYGEEYNKPPIVFRHGKITNSGGSTAMSESRVNPENHVVRGHTHRAEWVQRTTRAGNYLSSIVVGVLCSTTGEVPGYHTAVDDNNRVVKHQENQQQGVLVIRDYGGDYEFTPIPIQKGTAHYNGKRYEA